MGSILGLCQWLATTSVSVGIRESSWAYPIVESVHVLGLTLFMGLLVLWDCRLLGITLRSHPASHVWKQLIPWIALGAALMTVSGLLLFWSDPVRFYGNVFFRIKVVGLVFAAGTAMVFHFGIERRIAEWDRAPVTPLAAKVAGALSLGLWVIIILSGRFVAYNWFSPLV
jgi:hypothetical protein